MNRPHWHFGNSAGTDCTRNIIPVFLKVMLKDGLSLLWRGYEYARDLETDGWEFAIDGETLREAGLSAIDLRWLVARGYVEESERALDGKNARFILTTAGAALAWQILSRSAPATGVPAENEKYVVELSAPITSEEKPCWDRNRKELRFGESIIKQFRWAAANQEMILMAFEEEGWPPRIDDPLPQKLNQNPKSRLHDTIKCLNRNHRKRLIRFSGDGTGEGVLWILVHGNEPV